MVPEIIQNLKPMKQSVIFKGLGHFRINFLSDDKEFCRVSTVWEKFKARSEKEEYFLRVIHGKRPIQVRTLFNLMMDWSKQQKEYFITVSFNQYNNGLRERHVRAVFHFDNLPRLGNLENITCTVVTSSGDDRPYLYKTHAGERDGYCDVLLGEFKRKGMEDYYIRSISTAIFKEWTSSIVKHLGYDINNQSEEQE